MYQTFVENTSYVHKLCSFSKVRTVKVLMAETVASTSGRMFVEIRYKSLYMETYMVKQIISPPI